MLVYFLMKQEGDLLTYKILPERKEENIIIVTFNWKTCEREIIDLGIFEYDPLKYENKVLNKLEDYKEEGLEYPKHDGICWG